MLGGPTNPLIGPRARLGDVDWVGVTTYQPTGKSKKCGGTATRLACPARSSSPSA
jgi:hypothetical protein